MEFPLAHGGGSQPTAAAKFTRSFCALPDMLKTSRQTGDYFSAFDNLAARRDVFRGLR